MRIRALRSAVLLAALGLLGGCLPVPQPNRPANVAIDPQASLDPGTGCTPQLGIAKVHALFAAINRGDADAVGAMFPNEGEGLVRQPEFEFVELDLKATTPGEVAAVIRQLTGLHFVFTAPLMATAGRIDFYPAQNQKISVWSVAVGPVLWKTSGGSRAYRGGGKITFNCESGKFLVVTF